MCSPKDFEIFKEHLLFSVPCRDKKTAWFIRPSWPRFAHGIETRFSFEPLPVLRGKGNSIYPLLQITSTVYRLSRCSCSKPNGALRYDPQGAVSFEGKSGEDTNRSKTSNIKLKTFLAVRGPAFNARAKVSHGPEKPLFHAAKLPSLQGRKSLFWVHLPTP